MRRFLTGLRVSAMGLIAAILLLGASVARAQDVAAEVEAEAWQGVITSQIEAFRAKDATAAFQYAGSGFQAAFPNADSFFSVIVGSGYAPIMESRSHGFGTFEKMGERTVVQEVKLVGNDQSLYEAFYQLVEEANGWRVQGVQLVKQPGMGI